MRAFIARQEMVFVSAGGDCSMLAGPAGFVSVVGRRQVELPGLSVGRVSLLFVDFFDEVRSLRVAGRAVAGGRLVVEEAYFGGGVAGGFGGR